MDILGLGAVIGSTTARSFVLVLSLLLHAPLALAQTEEPIESPASPRERAEQLHERGLQALEALHFARARDLFIRSMAAHESLGSAFNLGLAFRGTGQASAAIRTWGRVLSGELGALTDTQSAQVESLSAELRREVAHLEVRLERPDEARIALDGESLGVLVAGEPQTLDVDPGRRILAISATGHTTQIQTITLARGGTERVNIALEDEGVGVFEHPLFWTGVALVVLAAAGVGIYFGTGPHFEDPFSEPPFGVVATLRSYRP